MHKKLREKKSTHFFGPYSSKYEEAPPLKKRFPLNNNREKQFDFCPFLSQSIYFKQVFFPFSNKALFELAQTEDLISYVSKWGNEGSVKKI